MGGWVTRVADLPKRTSIALVYSSAELCTRREPFGELSAEKIWELKERNDDNGIELTAIETVTLSLCSAETFDDSEVDTVSQVLQYTLAHKPVDRRQIHEIACLLLDLESLSRGKLQGDTLEKVLHRLTINLQAGLTVH